MRIFYPATLRNLLLPGTFHWKSSTFWSLYKHFWVSMGHDRRVKWRQAIKSAVKRNKVISDVNRPSIWLTQQRGRQWKSSRFPDVRAESARWRRIEPHILHTLMTIKYDQYYDVLIAEYTALFTSHTVKNTHDFVCLYVRITWLTWQKMFCFNAVTLAGAEQSPQGTHSCYKLIRKQHNCVCRHDG